MIEVTNLTKQRVDSGEAIKIAEKVLKGENSLLWDISIVFVECAKIKELNKTFRKINKPTDVLSFAGLEAKGAKEKIGEIFVCPEMVEKDKMNWAIAHSVLHLLGFTHAQMRKKQVKYL